MSNLTLPVVEHSELLGRIKSHKPFATISDGIFGYEEKHGYSVYVGTFSYGVPVLYYCWESKKWYTPDNILVQIHNWIMKTGLEPLIVPNAIINTLVEDGYAEAAKQRLTNGE